MKMLKKKSIALVATGISAIALISIPTVAAAQQSNRWNTSSRTGLASYTADLQQLNDSGVSGTAEFKFGEAGNSRNHKLKAKLTAQGTTPDQIHPVHIHGKSNPEVATCPTNAVDKNNDGFVSVVEGADTYGPIKISLTSPQTDFGAGPTPALFTPFAGTPDNNNFPKANADGLISLKQNYKFDGSAAAQGALDTLKLLEDQHVVVHGGMAPASVDADAFAALGMPVTGPMSAEVYDVLLPVACGEISKTDDGKKSVNHTSDRSDRNSNSDWKSDDY